METKDFYLKKMMANLDDQSSISILKKVCDINDRELVAKQNKVFRKKIKRSIAKTQDELKINTNDIIYLYTILYGMVPDKFEVYRHCVEKELKNILAPCIFPDRQLPIKQ